MAKQTAVIDPEQEIDDLIEEMAPEGHSPEELRQAQLAAFGKAVAGKRDEAVQFRAQSGIEDVWEYCEEAYLGIDDVNRATFSKQKWVKPMSMEGPVQTNNGNTPQTGVESTVFVPLTARYVQAGYAKVCEILLPPNDKAFTFSATPVPDLIKDQDSMERVLLADGQPAERDATTDELKHMGKFPLPPGEKVPGVPLLKRDLVKETLDQASKKATKAETRIYDWHVEGQYRAQNRKVVFDAARIGVGILKGPIPRRFKSQAMGLRKATVQGEKDRIYVQIKEEIKPVAEWLSPWDFFPDPSCGENIHDGENCFERARFSPKKLRGLKKLKGYNHKLIDQVLAEGPGRSKAAATRNPTEEEVDTRRQFELWYCYCTVTRDELSLVNEEALADVPKNQGAINVIVTLVNDSAIFAALHPLDSGNFPYRVMPWVRRPGHWAGVGVAEQVIVPQRIVNGASRAMMNNAGLSAGPQIVINRKQLEPHDGQWLLTPHKIWETNDDVSMEDAEKAFAIFNITNTTEQLMRVVEYGFRLAEEASSIPLITQGQSGKTTPDTFGAAQLQNNNANQLLRSIAGSYDDNVTEPIIRDYYEWLLLDPNIPDDEKGDFQINARGSSALVERAIQDQAMFQLGEIVLQDPRKFNVNPEKWLAEIMQSKFLDPRKVQYTPEEKKALDEQPQPVPPQVQAAMINAEARAKEAEASRAFDLEMAKLDAQMEERHLQLEAVKIKSDTDRDTEYVRAETDRTRNEHEARMRELTEKRELLIVSEANKRQMKVEDLKTKLATKAMELKTQRDLANAKPGGSTEVTTPPTEPPGRAPTGESYQA